MRIPAYIQTQHIIYRHDLCGPGGAGGPAATRARQKCKSWARQAGAGGQAPAAAARSERPETTACVETGEYLMRHVFSARSVSLRDCLNNQNSASHFDEQFQTHSHIISESCRGLQEVLERTVELLDRTLAESTAARDTIAAQENQIAGLTEQLRLSQRREAELSRRQDLPAASPAATPAPAAAAAASAPAAQETGKVENRGPLQIRQQSDTQPREPDQTCSSLGLPRQQPPSSAEAKAAFRAAHAKFAGAASSGPNGQPGILKPPELSTACKITMAARASGRPQSGGSDGGGGGGPP